MKVETTGQETFEPNESPSSAPAAIESSSKGSEEVKKMEDQIQFMENYKLELTALTNEVAKMNLEIQELKKKKEKKGNRLLGAQQPMTLNGTTSEKKSRISEDTTKCGLCRKLKDLGIQPKDKKHHLTIRGNIEPESCGLLRDLNIQGMAELFKKYEMCRVCGYRPVSDAHHEDKCKYTKNVTLAKCQVKDCRLRYFLCAQHEAKNESQIQNRMEYYKNHNFPFNPKKSNSKQQKETREVSTQTADYHDSTMTNEVETVVELEIDSTSSSPVIEADQETRSDSDSTGEIESEIEQKDTDLPEDEDSAASNLE